MWVSLPTRGTQTLTVWGPGGVPQRTKWELGVLSSLSESLVQGMNMLGEPAHEPSFLLVYLSWVMPGDHTPKASTLCRTLTPTSPSHLTMEYPPKMDSHINITTEVQELLSHAVLDTSSQALGDSTPKEPTSLSLGVSPPSEQKTPPSQ